MNTCEDDDCGYAAFYQQQLLQQQEEEERKRKEEQDLLKADPAYQEFVERYDRETLQQRIEKEHDHGSR